MSVRISASTRWRKDQLALGQRSVVPLAVVIPTRRPRVLRDNLVRSLSDCDPMPAQLIVVDDGSEQNAEKYLGDLDTIQLLRNETRQGPARARNLGAAAARQPVVVFLDDDIMVSPELFARIGAHFEDPEMIAVTGLFSRDCFYKNFSSVYKNEYMHYICRRSPRMTQTLLTAVCAVRKDALDRVGGFDETIRAATVEDIELGRRLSDDGPAVVFDPELQVTHLKHYRFGTLVGSHFRRSRDMARYLLRRLPFGMFGDLMGGSDRLCLPWHFSLGVLLAALWLISPLAYVWLPARFAMLGQVAPPLLIGLINLPFLAFMGRRDGLWFALRAWPVLCLELVLSVFASVWAVLSWPFGGGDD